MKIKPTLVILVEKGSMVSLVFIKTQNAPIPTMKIHPSRILNRFFELNSVELRCSLNPKAQAVIKAHRQLRPNFQAVFSQIF